MFSNRTEPRSIASRLVLPFTLAAVLLLSIALGIFYWLVVRHTFAEDNAVLADKLDVLQRDFQERGGVDALAAELSATHGWERAPFLVRVLDPAGKTIGQTPGMEKMLPPNSFPPATSTETPIEQRRAGKLFALTTRHGLMNGQMFTIQVAQDRSSDDQLEREFRSLVVIVLVIGSLAAAVLAMTVTRRGLRPLQTMKSSLERVGPTHLNERVSPAGWPRELQPLAIAFDEMLARLEDSFTRLSQFSADLAHELRTPLTNIMGEAQVALTRERTPDEYREVIESTITECERLSGIAENLLFVARADSAREPVQRQVFDGRVAVRKVAAFYRTVAEDRHVAIRSTGAAEIYADPVLFERALSNLVDNALRFTSDGGEIKIDIARRDAETEVRVTDNGSGIATEHLPRVFDRFYRVDSSRSSSGAGLGLALVKSIVDLHGGSAKIQSEIGRGTTVNLIFPLPQK